MECDKTGVSFENLSEFIAHEVKYCLYFQLGGKPFLHTVDHRQFTIAFLRLFQQTLSFLKEAYVLDRNCCLVGKRLDQCDLFVRQQFRGLPSDGNHAHRFPFTHQGHSTGGAIIVFLRYSVPFWEFRVDPGLVVDGLQRSTFYHRSTSHRILIEMDAFSDRDHRDNSVMRDDFQEFAILGRDDRILRT